MDQAILPETDDAESGSAAVKASQKQGKRLVVFADGTGNAFGTQATNVWRLYDALDTAWSDPQQSARYIPGVGTSTVWPIRLIDGSTGLGVPSNVRKLYRFICWNWEPGDEIWVFGFSRGAFTVRALAGMIKRQGLVPRVMDGRPVSIAAMKRNAMGAWRAYREETAPFRVPGKMWPQMSPTIAVARALRNGVIRLKRWVLRQPTHAEILERQDEARRAGAVKIKFMGLFDTVEAYGVPVEEIRIVVDRFLWPISFRNRVCSDNVENVRHALSLDDERRTFHPVRFDQTPTGKAGPSIHEVWFAGVHSDVGGGYPDDAVSLEALDWMAKEASALGLKLDAGRLSMLISRRSALARIHDSRSGLSSVYRYAPRPIERDAAAGGAPVLHPSVIAKMRSGADGYAPLMLAEPFSACGAAAPKPDFPTLIPGEIEAAQSLAFWRQLLSIAFVSVLFVLLVFPWTAEQALFILQGESYAAANHATTLADPISGLLPGWLQTWIKAYLARPLISLPLIALAVVLFLSNAPLRDRIKDRALLAWRKPLPDPLPKGWWEQRLLSAGRALRESWLPCRLASLVSRVIAPAVLLLILTVGALKVVHSVGSSVVAISGVLCPAPQEPRDQPKQTVTTMFSPKSLCAPVKMDALIGQRYSITLTEKAPILDKDLAAPLAGFRTNAPRYLAGALFRRADADWLQPVIQIGRHAAQTIPLASPECPTRPFVRRGSQAGPQTIPEGCGGPSEKNERVFKADFVAEANGPIYLYLNDVAFWGRHFYENNEGEVQVEIQAVKQ